MTRSIGLKGPARVMIVLVLALVLCTWKEPVQAQTVAEPENTILVHGSSEITTQPDSVSVSLAVETQGATLEQARNQNSRKMQQVMSAIRQLNIADLRMQTQGFNAYPVYADQQKSGEAPRIVAYRVTNSINVEVEGIASKQVGNVAGRVVDTASQNGVSSVNGLRFYLKNMQAVQNQAIEAAMTDARKQADTLAHSAGVTIKGVYAIEGSPQSQVRPMQMMALRSAQATPTPVEPGVVTVTSDVTVRYRF